MKKLATALVMTAGLAMGCAEQKKPSSTAPSALDVNPPATTVTPVAYTPAPSAAPVLAAPDSVTTQTPSAAVAGGSTYTVKKGDTLYKIAKDHYGDGKQWQKIASANPGVSPQTLKVGQTLTLP